MYGLIAPNKYYSTEVHTHGLKVNENKTDQNEKSHTHAHNAMSHAVCYFAEAGRFIHTSEVLVFVAATYSFRFT